MCVKHLGVGVSCESCTLVNKLPVFLPVLRCLAQVDKSAIQWFFQKLTEND